MNFDYPLFDSATHPTIDGRWLRQQLTEAGVSWASIDVDPANTLKALTSEMQNWGVNCALAMGMEGIGSYSENRYVDAVRAASSESARLLPIAFASSDVLQGRISPERWISRVKGLGYLGIKIHPRVALSSLEASPASELIAAAEQSSLPVMICTYFASPHLNPVRETEALWTLLQANLGASVILIHGGLAQVMEYSLMVKALPRAILDLSYTLCKFSASSIDLDLQFLARTLDQKLCVGSDSPEFTLKHFRHRFEWLTEAVSPEQKSNIASSNLLRVFDGVA